jgi:hypothetical protein
MPAIGPVVASTDPGGSDYLSPHLQPSSFQEAEVFIPVEDDIGAEVHFADLPKKGEAQSEATIRRLVMQVSAR